jgi:hypothetical protein
MIEKSLLGGLILVLLDLVELNEYLYVGVLLTFQAARP